MSGTLFVALGLASVWGTAAIGWAAALRVSRRRGPRPRDVSTDLLVRGADHGGGAVSPNRLNPRRSGPGTRHALSGGMTAPRQIRKNVTYLITRRCFSRMFLLRPSAVVTSVFEYVLAVKAKQYGIQLHAYCVLSNHWHCVLTDPLG